MIHENLTAEQSDAISDPKHVWDNLGVFTVYTGEDMPTTTSEPISVSATQFIRALIQLDMYDEINTAVAASDSTEVQALWARAPTFASNDPLLVVMAGAIGLTNEQVLDVFRLAQTL